MHDWGCGGAYGHRRVSVEGGHRRTSQSLSLFHMRMNPACRDPNVKCSPSCGGKTWHVLWQRPEVWGGADCGALQACVAGLLLLLELPHPWLRKDPN